MTGRGGVANNTDLKRDYWYRNAGISPAFPGIVGNGFSGIPPRFEVFCIPDRYDEPYFPVVTAAYARIRFGSPGPIVPTQALIRLGTASESGKVLLI